VCRAYVDLSKAQSCYPSPSNSSITLRNIYLDTILLDGLYEAAQLYVLQALLQFLSTKSKILYIDVGANIGNHVLHLAPYFDHCLAFEPQPLLYDLLHTNLKYNDITNVTAFSVGLSDCDSHGSISFDKDNPGGCSITPSALGSIPLHTLDGVLGKMNFCGYQSVIKIDVEGMEDRVINGALDTIRSHKPFILFEHHNPNHTKRLASYMTILVDLGYYLYDSHMSTTQAARLASGLIPLPPTLGSRHLNSLTRAYYPLILAAPLKL
jgi:FkbM family methyltransferase